MIEHVLDPETVSYLSSTRLDFSLWLEETNAPPPVAFRTRRHLEDWSRRIGDMRVIPHGRSGRAVRVHGFLRIGWYYDQIWAAKGYGGYRKLMLAHANDGFDVAADGLRDIDADHVVARSILRFMPDAWVNVFPVPSVSNRPFGRIEKLLPKATPSCERIELSPITALKLFCNRYPRTHAEQERVMRAVRGQIMNTSPNVQRFVHAMDRDIRPYLK